jgi:hypothetical protein
MNKEDFTPQNLKALIDISNYQNEFPSDYIIFENLITKDPIDMFLKILWYSSFELFEIEEFKEWALQFSFDTPLIEMPKHINENNEGTTLDNGATFVYYSWVRIIAIWRLNIGC